MERLDYYWGKLIEGGRLDSDYKYGEEDWRGKYYNKPSMLGFFNYAAELEMAMVFPYCEDRLLYMHTSLIDDISKEDNIITIKTMNSWYKFEIDNNCLTDEQKTDLMVNTQYM